MKTVTVIAYELDALPAHVRMQARGSAGTLCAAVRAAVSEIFRNPQLKRKRLRSFRLLMSVEGAGKEPPEKWKPPAMHFRKVGKKGGGGDEADR